MKTKEQLRDELSPHFSTDSCPHLASEWGDGFDKGWGARDPELDQLQQQADRWKEMYDNKTRVVNDLFKEANAALIQLNSVLAQIIKERETR